MKKPAQYIGGEFGSVVKNDLEVDLHVCLAFPDTYEVGMSHLGLQVLYAIINKDPRFWAERVFAPLDDMETWLREHKLALRSLEAGRPLHEFAVLGISLQFELCASNVLTLLDLGGIPLLSRERTSEHPFVIGGGPLASHPEPLADFFDAFALGDGEELVLEILETIRNGRLNKLTRQEILDKLSRLEGLYVPAFFEARYEQNPDSTQSKTFAEVHPLRSDYRAVRRRILPSLAGAAFPQTPIIPHIRAVHDRLGIEVMRGCLRGCRFCQAGYIYRPQRERSPQEVLQIAGDSLKRTGYEELALLSLSTADYSSITPLVTELRQRFAADGSTFISFPSTRLDAMTPEFLAAARKLSHSGFTIAPEAGTQRLRDAINKGISDQEILETCCRVFEMGWKSIKMYFMIGLPSETDDDIYGIADLVLRIREATRRGKDLTVSVSTFIPKPHTPFQWAAQISLEETSRRQQILSNEMYRQRIKFRYHDSRATLLEGVLARGDRQLSQAILLAYQLGCRMDSWTENLKFDVWMDAFSRCGIDPQLYLKARSADARLPWDHLQSGVEREFLRSEWEKTFFASSTPDCLHQSCSVCGVCDHDRIKNIFFPDFNTAEPVNSASPQRAKAVQRIRLQYRKTGPARFLSHLELQLAFQRAVKRAGLPIAFSNAIHTQPRIIFGPPLQIGIESECELVDLLLTEQYNAQQLIEALNRTMPSGIQGMLAREIPLNALPVQAATKNVSYQADSADPQGGALLELSPLQLQDWPHRKVRRLRKNKEVEIALSQYVSNVHLEQGKLVFTISYDPDGSALRPLEVLETLSGMASPLFRIKKTACEL